MPSNGRCERVGVLAGLALMATTVAATAGALNTISGEPPTLREMDQLAARTLPFGHERMQPNGNPAVGGRLDALGRRPSLSERGMLLSPGEMLQ